MESLLPFPNIVKNDSRETCKETDNKKSKSTQSEVVTAKNLKPMMTVKELKIMNFFLLYFLEGKTPCLKFGWLEKSSQDIPRVFRTHRDANHYGIK